MLFLAVPGCDFAEARALTCPGAGEIEYEGISELASTLPSVEGIYLGRDELVCHHFSYVPTPLLPDFVVEALRSPP